MSNAYRAVVQAGGGAAVGDATAADVLTGKTFSGAVGSGVTGTMPNNGAVTQTVSAGQSYTIPAGYHNGSGTVTGSSLNTREAAYGASPAGTVSFTADKDYPSGTILFSAWPTNKTVEVDNVAAAHTAVTQNIAESNLPIMIYKLDNTLPAGKTLKITSTATNVNYSVIALI